MFTFVSLSATWRVHFNVCQRIICLFSSIIFWVRVSSLLESVSYLLYVCFCGCRQYMVVIPAVVEAGAETKFCASLLQPSEPLVMTITLFSQEKNTTLLHKTSSAEFHTCVQFQVTSSHSLIHSSFNLQKKKILLFIYEQHKNSFMLLFFNLKDYVKIYTILYFLGVNDSLGWSLHFYHRLLHYRIMRCSISR